MASQTQEERLAEALDSIYDRLVDLSEPYRDEGGEPWLDVSYATTGSARFNAAQLDGIRQQCRRLAIENEFAINGHENRVNYIVGTGHSYKLATRSGQSAAAFFGPQIAAELHAILESFLTRNRWHQRQQEIVRRKDRDGECFIRFFETEPGELTIRFVEPEQVKTPDVHLSNPVTSHGIVARSGDAEDVEAYFIDDELVDASVVQHRKLTVDANVRRGVPLFYPVRKNLRRVERILRNMSTLTEIQSAIALIRRHATGTASSIERFVADGAVNTNYNPKTGNPEYVQRYAPGTILDASAGTEYDFPAAGVNAAAYVAVLSAELRAIAARLVMPEFMLSSNAANANYASTMVAEGPAVKMFQRLQHDTIVDDKAIFQKVFTFAANAGKIPSEVLSELLVEAIPPMLTVRDRLKDAQADQILVNCGAMTPETMAMRHGLS